MKLLVTLSILISVSAFTQENNNVYTNTGGQDLNIKEVIKKCAFGTAIAYVISIEF